MSSTRAKVRLNMLHEAQVMESAIRINSMMEAYAKDVKERKQKEKAGKKVVDRHVKKTLKGKG